MSAKGTEMVNKATPKTRNMHRDTQHPVNISQPQNFQRELFHHNQRQNTP